ncbi:hypothetical protein RJ55_02699 [Drechmeria coniospora]|nr:hypothetical protein RJ55_02699 [Drechmeria coniospora]
MNLLRELVTDLDAKVPLSSLHQTLKGPSTETQDDANAVEKEEAQENGQADGSKETKGNGKAGTDSGEEAAQPIQGNKDEGAAVREPHCKRGLECRPYGQGERAAAGEELTVVVEKASAKHFETLASQHKLTSVVMDFLQGKGDMEDVAKASPELSLSVVHEFSILVSMKLGRLFQYWKPSSTGDFAYFLNSAREGPGIVESALGAAKGLASGFTKALLWNTYIEGLDARMRLFWLDG